MVAILIMSAKVTTLGLLKINVFKNKCYDVIVSDHDITNKTSEQFESYSRCSHITKVW